MCACTLSQSTWQHTKAPTHGHTRRLTRTRGVGSNRTSDISSGTTDLESFDDDDDCRHIQHSRHLRQSGRNPLISLFLLTALALGCGCCLRWFVETTPRKRSNHSSASTTTSVKPIVGPAAIRTRGTFSSSDVVARAAAKTTAGQGLVWAVHVGQSSTGDRDSDGWARQEEREVRGRGKGGRHAGVPDWERPSKGEVEDILLGQVCSWVCNAMMCCLPCLRSVHFKLFLRSGLLLLYS